MVAVRWMHVLVVCAAASAQGPARQDVCVLFVDGSGDAVGHTMWSGDCAMQRVSERARASVDAWARASGGHDVPQVELACKPKAFLSAARLFGTRCADEVVSADDVEAVLALVRELGICDGDEKTAFLRRLACAAVDGSVVEQVWRSGRAAAGDVCGFGLELLRVRAGKCGMDVRVSGGRAVLCARDHCHSGFGSAELTEAVEEAKVHCSAARALAAECRLRETLGWFVGSAGVRRLDLSGCRLRRLAAWVGGLQGLAALDVSRSGLGAESLEHLAGLRGVEELNISHNRLRHGRCAGPRAGVLRAVAKLEGLRVLAAAHCGLAVQDIEGIRGMGLRMLDVSGNRLGDAGAACVGVMWSLEGLRMDRCGLVPGSVVRLRGLSGLRRLSVSGSALSGDDVACVGEMRCLESLEVGACGLVPGSVVRLRGLSRLRRLSVSGNVLSGDDVACIKEMRGLRHLDLRGCAVGRGALAGLGGALVELDVSRIRLSEKDAAAIGRMRSLRRLVMHRCGRAQGIIRCLGGLKNLEHLSISRATLGTEDVGAIGCLSALRSLDMLGCRVEHGTLWQLERLRGLELLRVHHTALRREDRLAVRKMRGTAIEGLSAGCVWGGVFSTTDTFEFVRPCGMTATALGSDM